MRYLAQRTADADLYNLVPFDYALWRWQQGATRSPDDYRDVRPPQQRWIDRAGTLACSSCARVKAECACCPGCGWPRGQRGFLRICYPVGHELFAKAICCPTCWPAPFGHAGIGALSETARKVKGLWEKVYRETSFDPITSVKRIMPSSPRVAHAMPKPAEDVPEPAGQAPDAPVWQPPPEIQRIMEEVFGEPKDA